MADVTKTHDSEMKNLAIYHLSYWHKARRLRVTLPLPLVQSQIHYFYAKPLELLNKPCYNTKAIISLMCFVCGRELA